MKRKVSKAAFDKLDKAIQALYKKQDGKDGEEESYILDVEDDDDSGESPDKLKSALQRERDANKKLRDDMKALRTEFEDTRKALDEDSSKKARESGDIKALESSWQKKLEDREKELQGIVESRERELRSILVDQKAHELASSLTKHPGLLLPHLKTRLQAEFGDDGKAITRILDKDGKPSALSLDDLKKEFLANKEFSAILTASSGSGGGAGGSPNSGGGSFELKTYQNADGTVNWQKVNLARKDNPDVVSQVQQALNPSAAAEG